MRGKQRNAPGSERVMARQGGGIGNPECPCGMERFLSGGKGSKHSMNRQSHPVFTRVFTRPLRGRRFPEGKGYFFLCKSLSGKGRKVNLLFACPCQFWDRKKRCLPFPESRDFSGRADQKPCGGEALPAVGNGFSFPDSIRWRKSGTLIGKGGGLQPFLRRGCVAFPADTPCAESVI